MEFLFPMMVVITYVVTVVGEAPLLEQNMQMKAAPLLGTQLSSAFGGADADNLFKLLPSNVKYAIKEKLGTATPKLQHEPGHQNDLACAQVLEVLKKIVDDHANSGLNREKRRKCTKELYEFAKRRRQLKLRLKSKGLKEDIDSNSRINNLRRVKITPMNALTRKGTSNEYKNNEKNLPNLVSTGRPMYLIKSDSLHRESEHVGHVGVLSGTGSEDINNAQDNPDEAKTVSYEDRPSGEQVGWRHKKYDRLARKRNKKRKTDYLESYYKNNENNGIRKSAISLGPETATSGVGVVRPQRRHHQSRLREVVTIPIIVLPPAAKSDRQRESVHEGVYGKAKESDDVDGIREIDSSEKPDYLQPIYRKSDIGSSKKKQANRMSVLNDGDQKLSSEIPDYLEPVLKADRAKKKLKRDMLDEADAMGETIEDNPMESIIDPLERVDLFESVEDDGGLKVRPPHPGGNTSRTDGEKHVFSHFNLTVLDSSRNSTRDKTTSNRSKVPQ